MSRRPHTDYAVLASAQRSAGDGYTSWINVSSEKEVFIEVKVTAKSGAPALDMVLQCSPIDPNKDGTRWAAIAVEPQITNAQIGTSFPKIFRSTSHSDFVGWVRVLYTVGGITTPKLTFSINLQSKS